MDHGPRPPRGLNPLALLTRARRRGVVVRLPVPGARVYLVNDPTAIQEVLARTQREYAKGVGRRGREPLKRVLGDGLLTSPPDLHREQRRLVRPLFHRERVAGYAETFTALAEAAAAGWRDGEVRDLHRDMTALTLAIVARTVFDADVGDAAVTTVSRALARNQRALRREILPGGTLLDRLPLPATRRWRADSAAVDAVVYGLIEARRAEPGGSDLLSLLLATGMPDRRIRDEALTLLLAGHETTANALAWTFALLSHDPAAQERIAGGDPAFTSAVVRESLRLYPPAWAIWRHLVEAREVGGRRLPAGATLILSPWVTHRDPAWWPEPERFRPERWLDGPPPERYAYFPFGSGPRQCVGNEFAELEAARVTEAVCARWLLTPAPGARPVVPRPLITLRPRYGVPLLLNVRR
ncbi:cytochrome P450 [Phytohabitans sp. ZYX-F-186]|uniref:Cytochrome P450 n=1 Tax=Phytohabitans maris TaxID=3071409 RepID=A0ABU0ZJN6_9ACTN|nr:cytochrome P450 [Phytohabitans sp. ZYX-F-186]MDQ7906485.1 cytochrome P450 [Phytohabitans sp. ZYX-F-186]